MNDLSGCIITREEIQNELLEAMALGMTRQISANIQNATCFAIMADETADVSNKEQLVFCNHFWRETCMFKSNRGAF